MLFTMLSWKQVVKIVHHVITRLKQGESINVQDLKTNLYWEFEKFTSWDGELESYYLRFVTLVKQSQELKTVSYHKLYDILKQHQNEVNEIRSERLARTANQLAFFAQQQPDYHSQNHPTNYTQNSSTRSQQFFYIFGSLCYIVRDGENLDKMKEKGDACIFVGYFTQSRAYQVYNKRTRVIIETIHVNFDELPQMASDHISSDLIPQCPTMAFEHASLSPGPQSQENVPQLAETVTTSIELDLLFSLMFDELLNETTPVVSKSSAVTATDAPNQRQ
nr:hypothetical protein [Tanacetum cinerariifolium]